MGMESYYITLNIENLNSSDTIMQLLKQNYHVSDYKMPSGKLFKRYIIDDSRFVIDNKAVVAIGVNQNVTEVTFELCFSNYENNLSYIYNVAKCIASLAKTMHIKVLNTEYNFGNLDYEKFKEIVSKSFCKKYHLFFEHYGEISQDILPCNFYAWIRKRGMKRKA